MPRAVASTVAPAIRRSAYGEPAAPGVTSLGIADAARVVGGKRRPLVFELLDGGLRQSDYFEFVVHGQLREKFNGDCGCYHCGGTLNNPTRR